MPLKSGDTLTTQENLIIMATIEKYWTRIVDQYLKTNAYRVDVTLTDAKSLEDLTLTFVTPKETTVQQERRQGIIVCGYDAALTYEQDCMRALGESKIADFASVVKELAQMGETSTLQAIIYTPMTKQLVSFDCQRGSITENPEGTIERFLQ